MRRNCVVSPVVQDKLTEITAYIRNELKLSEQAAYAYRDRFLKFLAALDAPVTHALCRYKPWRKLGYRCAVFEKSWVFAYEIFDEGVIVRDIRHGSSLTN